jgi:hypothetical protein
MKRFVAVAVFLAAWGAAAPIFAIGITFGPFANEEYVIHSDDAPTYNYGVPLFLGGIYHKLNIGAKAFYYVDLSVDIHYTNVLKANPVDDDGDIFEATNVILYLHNDINYYPFDQRLVYVGGGIEVLAVDRISGTAKFTKSNDTTYLTTHFFGYVDAGIAVPVGKKFEAGLKMVYRLLPFNIGGGLEGGEISLAFGFAPPPLPVPVVEAPPPPAETAIIVY